MRYFTLFMCCVLLAGCGKPQAQDIEFFTHEGCPYCAKAQQYLQINYPKLPIQILEIEKPENMQKFVRCAEKFKLNKQKLGTPLICMHNHYIMGWSAENMKQFNEYIKPYLKK